MRITNNTHWNTAQLRAFVVRVAADELEPHQRKKLRVTIGYNRQRSEGWCSGWAYLRSLAITVNVPSQVVNRIDLAHVIAHEMAHSRGVTHQDMGKSPHYRRTPGHLEIYAWAADLPLEKKAKVKASRPTPESRLARIEELTVAWKTRAKRAATRLKTLSRQRRYYEKRAAAMRAPRGGTS